MKTPPLSPARSPREDWNNWSWKENWNNSKEWEEPEWNEPEWNEPEWKDRSYAKNKNSKIPSPLQLPPGIGPGRASCSNPLFIFLDSSAILKMAYPKGRCLLSFEQMLFLCAHKIMAYAPRSCARLPPMNVSDADRILFVITDVALDMLSHLRYTTEDAELAQRIKWLKSAEDSILVFCHTWGILEIVESKYDDVITAFSREERTIARQCNLNDIVISQIDFILLWARMSAEPGASKHAPAKTAPDRTVVLSGNKDLVAYWQKHRPNHAVKCFDIDQVQACEPQEWRLLSTARCGQEVERINDAKKCLTADIMLRGLKTL